jgi:hypothetical protein
MRRVASVLLAVLALVAFITPARADIMWCKTDPVITLNGAVVDISVAIPLEYVPLVNGPVRYEVKTPASTRRQLVVNDLGYNGYGSEVIFTNGNGTVQNGKIPTTVRVYVPIDESRLAPGDNVPAELTIIADDLSLVVTEGTSEMTAADTIIEESSLLNLGDG